MSDDKVKLTNSKVRMILENELQSVELCVTRDEVIFGYVIWQGDPVWSDNKEMWMIAGCNCRYLTLVCAGNFERLFGFKLIGGKHSIAHFIMHIERKS